MEMQLLVNGEKTTLTEFLEVNYNCENSDDRIVREDAEKVSRMGIGDVVFIGISEIKRIK